MIKHILKLIWNKKRSNALMILEIFLAFIVLFFVLSYVLFNTERISKPLGFATEDRWMIFLDGVENMDSAAIRPIVDNLRRNLLSQDEILGVSFLESISPFSDNAWFDGNDENGFSMNAMVVPADIDYAEVANLNLVEGRWFSEEDLTSAVAPVIVNRNFLNEYYADESMLDSTFVIGGGEKRLIGVVDEYRYIGEFDEARRVVFELRDIDNLLENIVVHLKPNVPAAFEEKISKLVNNTTGTNGNVIMSLDKMKNEKSRNSWILLIALLSVCGFLCVNVALGLFGVLWYNISKRKSEIGLRQALGAHGFDITKQFILEIMILTLFALVVGIFFAVQIPILEVTEYPSVLFYKSIFYSTIIILVLVMLCAFFPALQASKITPATALHED